MCFVCSKKLGNPPQYIKCLVNELQYGVTVGGRYHVYSLYTPFSWSYSGLYPRSRPALHHLEGQTKSLFWQIWEQRNKETVL
jgi:hypothetical protein